MREQNLKESKAASKAEKQKPEVCKIDHDAEDALPRELCRVCTPVMASTVPIVWATTVAERRRDYRIPKGMSDEEGKAMLERREAERKAKAKERIDRMKVALAEKEAQTVAKANEKRQKQGLPPIESKPKEDTMPKAKKAKAPKGKNGNARKGSKSQKIAALLMRPTGCTSKEVLKATGWPTISMPAISKILGLRLRKEKTDDGLRYYGSR